MNVIDRAMVHYTEQPREAGRGLMMSEASFGAGVSVRRVREGEKDVCGGRVRALATGTGRPSRPFECHTPALGAGERCE